jgi:hypothetical protein
VCECVSVCRRSPTNGLSAREAAPTSDRNLSWPDTREVFIPQLPSCSLPYATVSHPYDLSEKA